ncbi:hypothetical protein KSW27_00120 [Holdemanella biformis]|uniref:AbiJ-NTD4 domain-containing protein n=1 Tax=Holdemanella biformis TaxID=1735 RepID=UPI001C393141|nr:hypothetical protein [Holdemanella biformis]MBV3415699.1 hypothetical protein [Holdemanella biformis]
MLFSERNIYKEKPLVLNNISENCKTRILNRFNIFFRMQLNVVSSIYILNILWDRLGYKVDLDLYELENKDIRDFLINKFNRLWYAQQWYTYYDILEMILSFSVSDNKLIGGDEKEKISNFKNGVNKIFVEENIGYRIINNQVVNITTEEEINEIEKAMDSVFDSVNDHFEKALSFYSDRKNPDYKNSIKESISAVESMCCIICGKKVELGKALGKLEKNGIYIHGAMKNGFQALYGYASDESGIRHGGIEDKEVTEEDAKFMLVTCSAFVNYLKVKFNKMKENGNG